MKRFPYPIALVALALIAAACSGDDAAETTTTAPNTTTTTVPETTTTAPPTTTTIPLGPPSLLNGLPVDDEDLFERRVVAVKIDNHPDARPQSGLQEAEAVVELIVEGGLTRFIALYHVTDSEEVGPIRSVRPTDPGLVRPLGATFQFSGGQPWIQSLVAAAEIPSLNENAPSTWRIPRNGRAYERTLYGSTLMIREIADESDFPDDPPPGAWFAFSELTEDDEPADEGEAATFISLDWSQWPNVNWEWDGERYLRFNGDIPHGWTEREDGLLSNGGDEADDEEISTDPEQDENGVEEEDDDTAAEEQENDQIAFDTLLVIAAEQYTACPGSGGGSCVPAEDTVGEGDIYLFHGGQVVEGTWQRDEIDEYFTLATLDGEELMIPAGRLWVSVFPAHRSVTWEPDGSSQSEEDEPAEDEQD